MFWGLASTLLLATGSSRRSPWAAAEWRLDLSIGRQPGTFMPEDWGASGGRLLFSVDCLATSENVATAEKEESSFLGNRKAQQMTILEDPTYITNEGEQFISIPENGGAWSLQLPRQKGQAGTLRVWLDLEDALPNGLAAQKNDVTLQANDRLYLTAKCWRESDFKIGRRKMKPIEDAVLRAQERLDSTLSHETGDRRLDGKNPLDVVSASVDMAVLVKDRDDCIQDLREAELIYPRQEDAVRRTGVVFGHWPGSTEGLIISSNGAVAVKRKKLLREEFHIVGKWKASPVVKKEEQEAALSLTL